jgi:hypothetical protein
MELAALGGKGRPATADLPTWSASVDALLRDIGIAHGEVLPENEPVRSVS